MIVGAIDPGDKAGIAVFDGTWQVGLIRENHVTKEWRERLAKVDVLYIERPKIYPKGKQKARPADIITLAIRAGELGGMYKLLNEKGRLEYVEPQTWKKQLDKDMTKSRILTRLSEQESRQMGDIYKLPEGYQNNVWDAVGLAMFATGRKLWS